jgi:hypothetical protein
MGTAGTHCPACNQDIGIMPIMTAPTPTRINCPHCKARLYYEKSGALAVALFTPAALMGGALYYVYTQSTDLEPWQQIALISAVGIAIWTVVELGIAHYLRKRKTLLRFVVVKASA